MALAPTAAVSAAAVAGATTALAYLDAKLALRSDLKNLYYQRVAAKQTQKDAKADRFSLWYRFEAQAKRLPETEQCIWSRNGNYTWKETYEQCCRYGQFMLSAGVEKGSLFAIYHINSPEFVFATVASWGIGSAPALINYNLGGDGLVHCLKVSGAKVLLVDEDEGCQQRIEDARDRIEQELGMRIVILDAATKAQINALEPICPDQKHRDGMKGKFPIGLIYTSGSTGMPKACPFEVQRAWALAEPRVSTIGIKPGPDGDRWYICMPLYHGTGFTTFTSCIINGVTTCIGRRFSTSRFWDDIRESDSTAFVYVGETARYLLNAPPSPLDKQHKAKIMFGNGLRPDVWRRFSERFGIERISEIFNSTEGVFALQNDCYGPFQENAVGYHGALSRFLLRNKVIPVKIDHETETIWRDPKTGFAKRTSYEEGGEILVYAPSEEAFVGYWRNPAATEKKFERNVFKKGDLYIRTGDALRRTPDGKWYFMDRLGDTFRWKSENVSTAEVAEALGHYPGIKETIVYGVQVPGHDGRAGCAAIFIDPEIESRFDYDALFAYCRSKLPKYAVPVFLRIMGDVTPMHNNKQNKIPLKRDGIDVDKIQAQAKEGEKVDKMFWCPSALNHPKAAGSVQEGFTEFTLADLESIRAAAPKL